MNFDDLMKGPGSLILPLAIGAASAFAPRTTRGILGGLSLAEKFGEKSRKRQQAESLRSILTGGASPEQQQQQTQQPQQQPTQVDVAQAQQPGAAPVAPAAPEQQPLNDWQKRIQSVLPPGIIKNMPDEYLPSIVGGALNALRKPEGRPYYDEKSGKFVVAVPPSPGEPSGNWRLQTIEPGTVAYGQDFDRAAATLTGNKVSTYAELLKRDPQAAQQVFNRVQALKANVGGDINQVSLELFGAPFNALTSQQDRATATARWSQLQRFKGVTIPAERTAAEDETKWNLQSGRLKPHFYWDGKTINSFMAPANAQVHVPVTMGGGEQRADTKFLVGAMDKLNSGTPEQQKLIIQDLKSKGYQVNEVTWPSSWLGGDKYTITPPAAKPAIPAPTPAAPTVPSTGGPAAKPTKKRPVGAPGPGYTPPWASDYRNKR